MLQQSPILAKALVLAGILTLVLVLVLGGLQWIGSALKEMNPIQHIPGENPVLETVCPLSAQCAPKEFNPNCQKYDAHFYSTPNAQCINGCVNLQNCSFCGNGKVDGAEQCDQGISNQANGDGCSNDCKMEDGFFCKATVLLPSECSSFSAMREANSLFGMQVLAISVSPEKAVVRTTGGLFELILQDPENNGLPSLSLNSRIDTANVDWATGKNAFLSVPKKTAKVSFVTPLTNLSLDSSQCTRDACVIESDNVRFEFKSNSVVLITAHSSIRQFVGYSFSNLSSNSEWNKQRTWLNRMWANADGGSLLANWENNPIIVGLEGENAENTTNVRLPNGATMAQMVFPAKPFDFESLYGRDARPFVQSLKASELTDYSDEKLQELVNKKFGALLVWSDLYTGLMDNGEYPVPISFNRQCLLGYQISPGIAANFNSFVSRAHAKGFKVIAYLYSPSSSVLEKAWRYGKLSLDNYPSPTNCSFLIADINKWQPIETTLVWMQKFQQDNRLDGWYLDNGDVGSLKQDMDFVRKLRTMLGDNGIIFVHESIDDWDWEPDMYWYPFSGLKAVPRDAYINFSLVGEVGRGFAEPSGPRDNYLRYYASGYGLSQALSSYKLLNVRSLGLSMPEADRALGENLNAGQRSSANDTDWLNFFWPAFSKRQQQFLSQSPDFKAIDWPINPLTGWFRPAMVPRISQQNGIVTLIWNTNEIPFRNEVSFTRCITLSDSDGARCSDQGDSGSYIWATPDISSIPSGPEGIAFSAGTDIPAGNSVRQSVSIGFLKPNQKYKFRIRSIDDTNPDGSNNYLAEWGAVIGPITPASQTPRQYSCPLPSCGGLLSHWSMDNGALDDTGNVSLDGNYFFGKLFGAEWMPTDHSNSDTAGSFLFNSSNKNSAIFVSNDFARSTTFSTRSSSLNVWIKQSDNTPCRDSFCGFTQYFGGFFSLGVAQRLDTEHHLITPLAVKLVSQESEPLVSTRNIPLDNAWHFVSFVFSDLQNGQIQYRFLIDGIPAGNGQTTGSFQSYPNQPSFGVLKPEKGFNGYLDEITVWNKALTNNQILTIKNS